MGVLPGWEYLLPCYHAERPLELFLTTSLFLWLDKPTLAMLCPPMDLVPVFPHGFDMCCNILAMFGVLLALHAIGMQFNPG